MKTIDANLVVRIITGDDPAQARSAAELIAADGGYVPLTVLLEAGWVLRNCYGWTRPMIGAAMTDFAALRGVSVEADAYLDWILGRYAAGADLGDIIHLVAARDTEAFVTFDARLARQAGPSAPVRVETLAA